ncbi:MAG: TetR/AcrR family transcriptional regulator [Anoxybacillus sp.]|nr:TetR/AcrR family transcriptional regulator [Anoxybacillus sp.]MCL6586684.1 TetR/AcrR family transcriptional regulator [Anoxybacillus sp.]
MKAINRKKQIMEAATKSFSLFGYKATTMEQVAKLANVGKGTIYTFFHSKEELLDEIITSLISEIKEAAEEAIDPSRSFFENVHRALYRILAFRKQHQLTMKLLQEVRDIGTPTVQEVMKKLDRAVLAYIRDKIEQAMQKGEIRTCDPEITAFLMFKLYIALVFEWEKDHEPLSEEKIAELFALYFLKGLSR